MIIPVSTWSELCCDSRFLDEYYQDVHDIMGITYLRCLFMSFYWGNLSLHLSFMVEIWRVFLKILLIEILMIGLKALIQIFFIFAATNPCDVRHIHSWRFSDLFPKLFTRASGQANTSFIRRNLGSKHTTWFIQVAKKQNCRTEWRGEGRMMLNRSDALCLTSCDTFTVDSLLMIVTIG